MFKTIFLVLLTQNFGNSHFYLLCPDDCNCFENEITCSNLQLTQIPNELSKKISTLDLSKNLFESIPSEIKTFENLTKLNYAYNRISRIDDNILASNVLLEELDFSYNNFATINDIYPLAFKNLKRLTRLDLAHNILGTTTNIFKSVTLQYLNLSNCSITMITNNFFAALPELKHLILANNPITQIIVPLVANNLNILDLSGCKIKILNENAFINMTKLEQLHLSNNFQLQDFNCKSKSLKYLDLSNCVLSTLPTNQIENLKEVNFSGNRLRALLNDTLKKLSVKLTHLDFSKNIITIIEKEAFRKLEMLVFINLSYNPIYKMDRLTFNTNFQLKTLRLSNTYLTEVPSFDIEVLEILDLSEGEINEFPKRSLVKMPFIKTLNLSRNLITHIPDNLESESLEILDLTWCRVSTIGKYSLKSLPRLRTLSLVGNRLTGAFNVSYFYGVQNLFISENMWRCDCNSTSFIVFHEFMKNNAIDYYYLKCAFPDNARGIHWEIYCGKYWYNDDGIRDRSWAIGIGLSVTLCVIMCVGYFLKRAYKIREEERRMNIESEREEARRRLALLRQRSRETVQEQDRNAPDPRDLQNPPSYNEAVLLPRIAASSTSLAGSQGSIHSVGGEKKKRKRRIRRRSRSKGSESDMISASSQRSINRRNSDSNSERQDSSDAEVVQPFKGYKESCI